MHPDKGHHSQSHFKFDPTALSVIAGGASTLDQSKLYIHNIEQADAFVKSYGFDYSHEEDLKRLWYFHRRSIVLMTEKLKFSLDEIPAEIKNPEHLKDMRNLLVWATHHDEAHIQKWACAMLRCIHVFVHSETDLFSHFAEEIQRQILIPFENAVVHEDKYYFKPLHKDDTAKIELHKFITKPFKTSTSTVIKLLAKPDALAVKVFDKLGVRIVTPTIFDSFQVIRYLVDANLISYPHIMPDQSSNNMYPVEEFLEVCKHLQEKHGKEFMMDSAKVDRLLRQQLKVSTNPILKLFRKENPYSSIDFRYIKFICRKLIKIAPGLNSSGGQNSKEFSFFYPFEVQIMDQHAYERMQTGDTDHEAYKNRQIKAARKRILST